MTHIELVWAFSKVKNIKKMVDAIPARASVLEDAHSQRIDHSFLVVRNDIANVQNGKNSHASVIHPFQNPL